MGVCVKAFTLHFVVCCIGNLAAAFGAVKCSIRALDDRIFGFVTGEWKFCFRASSCPVIEHLTLIKLKLLSTDSHGFSLNCHNVYFTGSIRQEHIIARFALSL